MRYYEKHIKKSFLDKLSTKVLLIGLYLSLGEKVSMLEYSRILPHNIKRKLLKEIIYETRFLKEKHTEEYKKLIYKYPYMEINKLKKLNINCYFKLIFK